ETPDGAESWWLHVERDERHSVDSLDARNRALHRFAETHGLEAYDGMDVGPVEPATD
ncbi:ribonuclease E inhibitor RraB, partial [Acinetobacter baumannii]